MCRFLAYRGEPVFMEDLISAPAHSLVHQSLHAEEAKTGTNGDGFGVGWYGDKPMPGLYREVHPAWSDENLKSLCTQVRSSLFFAHVRAATGTATTRANCHPFTHDQWMFMHNGQIGGWPLIRRKVESLIPDEYYGARTGTTWCTWRRAGARAGPLSRRWPPSSAAVAASCQGSRSSAPRARA